MKVSALFSTLALSTNVFALSTIALAATEEFKVDESHSKVGFDVKHMVISTVEGSFKKFDATFSFDAEGFENGKAKPDSFKLEANVDPASIDTGVEKRDAHLRAPDFFDVAKCPKLTFKSKKVEKVDDKKMNVTGDLNLHCVTKEVVFNVVYNGKIKDKDTLRTAFEGRTTISRKDFDLKWEKLIEAGPVVGNDVNITLKIEGTRKVDAKG